MATTTTPGVIAGDGNGTYQALNDFGEAYSVLAWNPAGTHLLFSGGKSGAAWYADANTGQRWRLPASLNNLVPIAWTPDGRYALLADGDRRGDPPGDIRHEQRGAGAHPLCRHRPQARATAATDLPMPYISQLWHTGVAFNGNWACGPTSVAMVLAYYGRLNPWPFAPVRRRPLPAPSLHVNAANVTASTPNLTGRQSLRAICGLSVHL